MYFAITDIETTGGKLSSNKITEIAIYKHNGKEIVDEFSTLVNPEANIPEFIVRLTGITNEMVRNAPYFYEIAKKIVEFTEDCVFVAHNVGFDYNIIRHEFRSLSYDFNKPRICTIQASKKIIPGLPSYNLGDVAGSLGIKIKNRHRAAGDALATAILFEKLFLKNKNKLLGSIKTDSNYKTLKFDFEG